MTVDRFLRMNHPVDTKHPSVTYPLVPRQLFDCHPCPLPVHRTQYGTCVGTQTGLRDGRRLRLSTTTTLVKPDLPRRPHPPGRTTPSYSVPTTPHPTLRAHWVTGVYRLRTLSHDPIHGCRAGEEWDRCRVGPTSGTSSPCELEAFYSETRRLQGQLTFPGHSVALSSYVHARRPPRQRVIIILSRTRVQKQVPTEKRRLYLRHHLLLLEYVISFIKTPPIHVNR